MKNIILLFTLLISTIASAQSIKVNPDSIVSFNGYPIGVVDSVITTKHLTMGSGGSMETLSYNLYYKTLDYTDDKMIRKFENSSPYNTLTATMGTPKLELQTHNYIQFQRASYYLDESGRSKNQSLAWKLIGTGIGLGLVAMGSMQDESFIIIIGSGISLTSLITSIVLDVKANKMLRKSAKELRKLRN